MQGGCCSGLVLINGDDTLLDYKGCSCEKMHLELLLVRFVEFHTRILPSHE